MGEKERPKPLFYKEMVPGNGGGGRTPPPLEKKLSLKKISEPTGPRGIPYAVFCLKKKKKK